MPACQRHRERFSCGADVQDAVASVRRGIENCLRVRIERDIKDGILPLGTQAAPLAGLVLAVTQGMSVLARDGASRASLLAVIEAALRAWPGIKADDGRRSGEMATNSANHCA